MTRTMTQMICGVSLMLLPAVQAVGQNCCQ